MNRRSFINAISHSLMAVPLAASSCGMSETVHSKPNIIFIMADDLGYGDLGCYGQELLSTPHIDALANEGVKFSQAYAGGPVCAASRSVLMTGLHNGHTPARDNVPHYHTYLQEEDITVAELLKQAGYRCGGIGKWSLGDAGTAGRATNQGFDTWFGYLNQDHTHYYYTEYLDDDESRLELTGNTQSKKYYSHDLMTERALQFINESQDEPFFLYAAYTAPHANNEAEGVLGVHGMEVPDYGEYADKDWPEPQKGHAAMISRLDRDIGALMDKLQALGIDDNTLVIFSSDNGPHKEGGADPEFFGSGGPLKGIKRDLYEGGIRVPMIARWPGNIAPGTVSSHVSSFWDFLPTAAEIAGVQPPAGIDGISYAPELLGESQTGHEFLYWEFHEGRESKQAVRMGNWKYVRTRLSQPGELYDLAVDIGETDNIAADHPDIVRKIETYIETARTESEHWGLRPS